MMNIKNIILIFIVGVLVYISAQNTQVINMKLIFWKVSVSLIALIYIVFFLGFATGMVWTSIKRFFKKDKKREKQILQNEKKKVSSAIESSFFKQE